MPEPKVAAPARPAKVCPKCGMTTSPTVRYVAPGQISSLRGDLALITGECLIETCQSCGYEWPTPCDDVVW